jgi:hypothetical protein
MNSPERPPLNVRAGLWALLLFACLGLALEAFHGFKLRFYLDVDNETRRLLWRLSHAHGALLGIVNVVYGLAARTFPRLDDALAGRALLAALVLLPLGFLLGGASARGGDPGATIGLAVAGGVALVFALCRLAWKAR